MWCGRQEASKDTCSVKIFSFRKKYIYPDALYMLEDSNKQKFSTQHFRGGKSAIWHEDYS